MMALFIPIQPQEGPWLAHCVGVLGSRKIPDCPTQTE